MKSQTPKPRRYNPNIFDPETAAIDPAYTPLERALIKMFRELYDGQKVAVLSYVCEYVRAVRMWRKRDAEREKERRAKTA